MHALLRPLLCALLLFSVIPAAAQDKQHITFDPVARITGKAGDTIVIKVTGRMDKGWHTYSTRETLGPEGLGPTPTFVSVEPASALKAAGKARFDKFKSVFDSSFMVTTEKVTGTFSINVPVRLNPKLQIGTSTATVIVNVQICDTMSCLPSKDYKVPVTVEITALADPAATMVDEVDASEQGGAQQSAATPPASSSKPAVAASNAGDADIEAAKKEGLWSIFLLGLLVGFGSLATPCVYPMVPITVSFFTKRHEKAKGKQLRDALIFALGIILTFSLIGILISAIWGASAVGQIASNPWINLGIGALFFALAFNLFGAYEIQVPVGILNALNKKSQGDGLSSTFLMGLTFALISFTCTSAFVAGMIGSAAQGEYMGPAIGMVGFSVAFAAPFFLLALFPSLMTRMPRSGGWMNNVKVVLGFLELGFALKFFSTAEFVWGWGVLPRDLFLAIWIGIAFLTVLYLVGTFRMKLDSPLESVSGLRAIFAVLFASVGFWLLSGIGSKPLGEIDALMPPLNYHEVLDAGSGNTSVTSAGIGSGPVSEAREVWFDNLDKAKAEAQRTGKPIFIDFTGFACTNCRWMELNMFPKSGIRSRMDRYVLVRLYTDRPSEPFISNQRMQETQYGTVALPLYVVLSKDGAYIAKKAFTRSEQDFTTFLDEGLPS